MADDVQGDPGQCGEGGDQECQSKHRPPASSRVPPRRGAIDTTMMAATIAAPIRTLDVVRCRWIAVMPAAKMRHATSTLTTPLFIVRTPHPRDLERQLSQYRVKHFPRDPASKQAGGNWKYSEDILRVGLVVRHVAPLVLLAVLIHLPVCDRHCAGCTGAARCCTPSCCG